MIASTVTLLVALLSAGVGIFGYLYQKRKEREFALATTRREIYEKLISSLTSRVNLLQKALSTDPDLGNQPVGQMYAGIAQRHPELWENIMKAIEINAMLCIYGTDPAVKKAASWSLESAQLAQGSSQTAPDLPGLVLTLRKSVYGRSRELEHTTVTPEEIRQLLTI
jgi:hypothetical protein